MLDKWLDVLSMTELILTPGVLYSSTPAPHSSLSSPQNRVGTITVVCPSYKEVHSDMMRE